MCSVKFIHCSVCSPDRDELSMKGHLTSKLAACVSARALFRLRSLGRLLAIRLEALPLEQSTRTRDLPATQASKLTQLGRDLHYFKPPSSQSSPLRRTRSQSHRLRADSLHIFSPPMYYPSGIFLAAGREHQMTTGGRAE